MRNLLIAISVLAVSVVLLTRVDDRLSGLREAPSAPHAALAESKLDSTAEVVELRDPPELVPISVSRTAGVTSPAAQVVESNTAPAVKSNMALELERMQAVLARFETDAAKGNYAKVRATYSLAVNSLAVIHAAQGRATPLTDPTPHGRGQVHAFTTNRGHLEIAVGEYPLFDEILRLKGLALELREKGQPIPELVTVEHVEFARRLHREALAWIQTAK